MDGGTAPSEEDYSKLSIEDRLEHKNWKARVSAYEELVKTFRSTISEDDRAFSPYLRDPSILRAAILDSNAVCQEKGIECACCFIEYAGKPAAIRSREAFMAAIVEKNVFGVTRAGTKKAVLELCLLLVECEDGADGVLDACTTDGLKSKQPKAVAGAVATMKEIVRLFGTKTVNVKPILKVIPTIFAHADKGVRAEGTGLVQELHRWLGAALDPHLAELKPVQIKELTESFVNEVKGEQTRYTRSQQRDRALKEAEATLNGTQSTNGGEATNGAEDANEAGDEEEAAIDPFELAEPVAILDKLPSGFYDNLASSKWKERKEEALDPLLEVLKKSPRTQDGNYDELLRALAGKMPDANIACVISAAACIEYMAKGLRSAFGRYKQIVVPPVLERCKEKKASVTDALAAALDAAFESVVISDIIEDVTTFAKHKNPQVKEQTFRWLVRSLKTTKVAPNVKTDLKPLTDALLHGFEDSFEPVRSAAAEGLGTLMKILGERALGPTIEALDDIKKAKVRDFAEKAEVKYKAGLAPVAKPAAAKNVAVPSVRTVTKPKALAAFSSSADKENAPPAAEYKNQPQPPSPTKPAAPKPPIGVRKPPVLSSAGPVKKAVPSAASSKPPSAHKPTANEPLKYRFTQEDAEAQAETTLPAEILADLGSSNWKLRLAALENLQAWLEGEGQSTESELVVRVLSKKPGWKESNFQVYGKMANAFQYLAEKSPNWSRACSALTIPALSDKLGDIKIKKPAGDALTAYAEKFSLQFVLSHAYDSMTKQKAPKAQADSLLWVEQALRDFGNTGIAVRDMIEFLKNGLKSSNAAVRTSATRTLVTLRLYVGPDIKTFLQDLNPTLLTTIDSEFDKAGSEAAPEPTRVSGDNIVAAAGASGGSGKAAKGGADPLDDLFPRQDLDKLIPNGILAGVGDANWKQRKESLEQIQGILETNKRLKPNIGDLGTALKLRMADSNKMVQGLALDIVARVATGMNKPFEKHARMFVGPICTILSDAKANVRAPAIVALSSIYDQCGLDCMISGMAASLETPNPVQRKELATWLGEKLKEGTSTTDLSTLTDPVIACLEDKSAEVRKAAQVLLPFLIASAGYQQVMDKTSGLKPASRSTVIPMIESAKNAATSKAASSATTPAVSRPSSSASIDPPQSATSSTFQSKPPLRANLAVNRTIRPAAASVPLPQSPAARSSSTEPLATAAIPSRPGTVRRPLASRPSLGTGLQTAVPLSQSPQDSSKEPPFRTSDPSAKQARGARETGPLKWTIDGSARPDQVDFLQQQFLPHASTELVHSLFSKDHHCERDFTAGLSSLLDCLSNDADLDKFSIDSVEMKARIIANADLILKYLTVRLADTATSMTIKCLEVVEGVFRVMLEDGYQLSDYEAGACLPSLIAKLGDGKEPIRNRVRTIVRSMGSIYPSSKTFSNLLEHGLQSKYARTRAESADELGYLFQRQGLSVCQPSKALPIIAGLISDKDAACRSAALSAISQAYSMVGDAVYKYIGDLPDREHSMLEEKLKRVPGGSPMPAARVNSGTAAGTPKRPESRQDSGRPEASQAPGAAGLSRLPSAAGANKRRQSALPVPGNHTMPISSSSHLRESHLPQPRSVAQAKTQASSPELPFSGIPARQRMVTDEIEPSGLNRQGSLEPEGPFDGILSTDLTQSVESLKRIQVNIAENPSQLAPRADQLVEAVAKQMTVAFQGLNAETPQATLRLCKHLMQTLSAFFDNKTLSLAVSREALITLLAELTKRLLETAASEASEAILSLSKVLNMVLIRIFHNADRSSCFGALFDILRSTTVDFRQLSPADLAERSNYAELVMKCLWKVSKSVKETLEDQSLDPRRLLLYIDRFLTVIPPAEWRRRASDNIPLADMPLRTIKTILQQVVTIFGEAVYDELALIERPENSFVYQYLFRLLNNSRQASSSESAAGSEILSRQSSTMSQVSNLMSRKQSNPPPANGPSKQSPTIGQVSSATNGTMSPGRSHDIEMNLALKEIFDKIGNAQESKRGIADLYEFQKLHPEADVRINTWITATGSFFQSYLKRALSNLAAEDAERSARSPSSLSPASRPVSTLPAAAPASPVTSPPLNGISGPSPGQPRDRASRVPSSSSASDERLNSLKQMFGVPAKGI